MLPVKYGQIDMESASESYLDAPLQRTQTAVARPVQTAVASVPAPCLHAVPFEVAAPRATAKLRTSARNRTIGKVAAGVVAAVAVAAVMPAAAGTMVVTD